MISLPFRRATVLVAILYVGLTASASHPALAALPLEPSPHTLIASARPSFSWSLEPGEIPIAVRVQLLTDNSCLGCAQSLWIYEGTAPTSIALTGEGSEELKRSTYNFDTDTYGWRLHYRSADGTDKWTEMVSFRVGPKPVTRLNVRLRPIMRWSETVFYVTPTPGGRQEITIRKGSRILRRSVDPYGDDDLGMEYAWNCAERGRLSYTVVATDFYGNRLTRHGHFQGRCPTKRHKRRKHPRPEQIDHDLLWTEDEASSALESQPEWTDAQCFGLDLTGPKTMPPRFDRFRCTALQFGSDRRNLILTTTSSNTFVLAEGIPVDLH